MNSQHLPQHPSSGLHTVQKGTRCTSYEGAVLWLLCLDPCKNEHHWLYWGPSRHRSQSLSEASPPVWVPRSLLQDPLCFRASLILPSLPSQPSPSGLLKIPFQMLVPSTLLSSLPSQSLEFTSKWLPKWLLTFHLEAAQHLGTRMARGLPSSVKTNSPQYQNSALFRFGERVPPSCQKAD